MSRRVTSLRQSLSIATMIVTMLALIATGALVTLTSLLGRSTATMADSIESIRLTEEAEIELLLHGRAGDTLVRNDVERRLRRLLAEARPYVSNAEEARLLAAATADVEAYIAASRELPPDRARPSALEAQAFGSLQALVTMNVDQARAAHARSVRWDNLADVLGLVVGGLLIAVSTGLLLWLRHRAFRPVLALAETMQRFGRGEREARARETGPAELREMSARFNEMASAIAAQRQAQMAFLGGIAHDLRDPLSAVSMSTSLLLADPGPNQVARTVDIVNRQVARLERMVGDLLELAKVDAGELELDLRIENLCDLVEGVIDLRRGSASRAQLELVRPEEPVQVRCDAVRIEQVISNLVSNSIKYSPGATPVEVEIDTQGGQAVLRVVDHGLGINEEDQQQLFEPFRRVGRSRDAAPGIGLGLWVVRRIIEAHGGEIAVASTVGGGATFTVRLPLHASTHAEPPPHSEHRPLLH